MSEIDEIDRAATSWMEMFDWPVLPLDEWMRVHADDLDDLTAQRGELLLSMKRTAEARRTVPTGACAALCEYYITVEGWDIYLTNEHLGRYNALAVHQDTGDERTVDVSTFSCPSIPLLQAMAALGFPARRGIAPWTLDEARAALAEARVDMHMRHGRFARLWERATC